NSFGARIPGPLVEEAYAECAKCRQRTPDQREDDAAENDQDRDGGRAGQVPVGRIAKSQPLQNFRPIHLVGDCYPGILQRHINHGRPPGRLHPALLWLSAIREGHSSGPEAATQAASCRRWTRKGRRCGALSARSSDQLVIANTDLPFASLISFVQYCSTSFTTFAGIGT